MFISKKKLEAMEARIAALETMETWEFGRIPTSKLWQYIDRFVNGQIVLRINHNSGTDQAAIKVSCEQPVESDQESIQRMLDRISTLRKEARAKALRYTREVLKELERKIQESSSESSSIIEESAEEMRDSSSGVKDGA